MRQYRNATSLQNRLDNFLGRGVGCSITRPSGAMKPDSAEQLVHVGTGLRRIENREHVNTTVRRNLDTGKQPYRPEVRMLVRLQFCERGDEAIDPVASVVIRDSHAIDLRTHEGEQPLFWRDLPSGRLVRPLAIVRRCRRVRVEIELPPAGTG